MVEAPPAAAQHDAATPGKYIFKAGDEVFFRIKPETTGNLRQYTVARTSQMARKPSNLGWVEAGVTPLSAVTAWQGVFDHGVLDHRSLLGDAEARRSNSKMRILITGVAGVVGSRAVQLAAVAGAGAIVAYTGGASSADQARKLGATEIIDYKTTKLDGWVVQDPEQRAADAVLDCVGGATLASCWHVAKQDSILLSVASDPVQNKPQSVAKTTSVAKSFLVEPKGSQLALIAKLMENGQCSAKVDSAVEFEDFQAAFDKVENKTAKGKVVIKVAKFDN